MKQCARCKIIKDETEFHKDKIRKDGLFSYCKPCKLRCDANRALKLRVECFKLFGLKCQRCGESNIDVLTINHTRSPTSDIYKGFKRGGVHLYKHLLDNPNLVKHFTLLCSNCNMLDYYKKSGYYNDHTSHSTLWYRQKKEKICQMWNNKCFHCFRTFPVEVLTVNHVHGGGSKEIKVRNHGYVRGAFYSIPTTELVERIDSGELELTCFNCNCNRTESSKWIKQGMARKKALNKSEKPI